MPSKTHGSLREALMAAQPEFPSIPRTRTANAGSYSYKYAPLDDIQEAVRPVLIKHGMCLNHKIQYVEGIGVVLATTLRHEGDADVSYFPLSGGSPQDIGKQVTYARRYNTGALLDLVIEDDTDAQGVASAAADVKAALDPSNDPAGADLDSWYPNGVPSTPGFGRDKNKPVTQVDLKSLNWYAMALRENADDPTKAKWKEKTVKELAVIEGEIRRRGNEDDENIPF